MKPSKIGDPYWESVTRAPGGAGDLAELAVADSTNPSRALRGGQLVRPGPYAQFRAAPEGSSEAVAQLLRPPRDPG